MLGVALMVTCIVRQGLYRMLGKLAILSQGLLQSLTKSTHDSRQSSYTLKMLAEAGFRISVHC